MTWTNADGLVIKFGKEGGVSNKGGHYSTLGPLQVSEIKLDYTDILSATSTVVGGTSGPLGIALPRGARIEEVEVVVETAFTSSGTIGSSTLVLGLARLDRTTELDFDGITTASLTGTAAGLATVGTKTVIRKGSTGVGALIGTNLANAGYLTVANSTHASNPFTAGKVTVRVLWYTPQTVG